MRTKRAFSHSIFLFAIVFPPQLQSEFELSSFCICCLLCLTGISASSQIHTYCVPHSKCHGQLPSTTKVWGGGRWKQEECWKEEAGGAVVEGVAMPTTTVTASFRPKVLAVLDAARRRHWINNKTKCKSCQLSDFEIPFKTS